MLDYKKTEKFYKGKKFKTLIELRNQGGEIIPKGSIVNFYKKYRGFGIEWINGNKRILIFQVSPRDLELSNSRNFTFSGWLRFVKKLTDKEISELFDNHKKCTKLEKEYEVWLRK